MFDEIFNHLYTRIIIAFILSLIIAFCDELEILQQPIMLFVIGGMIILLIAFDIVSDLGITLLMCSLFVLVYNIQTIHRM